MHKPAGMPIIGLLIGLAALAGQPALAAGCSSSATRTAQIDAGPLRKVVIRASAGDLVIRGEASRTTVQASGQACASSHALLDKIQIETHRDGDTLYIKTTLPETATGFWSALTQAWLDLDVDVPASVEIELEDSSGDTRISGVRAAKIADSSGDLEARDIHGNLSVTDSSGDIHIDTIAGNVDVNDSSGDIDVSDVTGNVEIPVDSSGGMRLRHVAGNVHVVSDSSGDIVIQQVRRDVTIDADSSGDIDVTEVAGNFTVGTDSSGDIRHEQVLGKVTLPPNRH